MSDVFASALEGQAIAGLIRNLKSQIADARASRDLETAVIQMQAAYEKRIKLLKISIDNYKATADNYKVTADNYKFAAERFKATSENNFIKGSEFKRLLEEERAKNDALTKELAALKARL